MNEPLKYLFTALFKDGTHLDQTPEDVSTIDTTKSAFYDVLQREDDLVAFALHDDKATYIVNVRTGEFATGFYQGEINQGMNVFRIGDPRVQLPPDTQYRLIFYRRHTHRKCGTDETHDIEYHLGWQTTVDGKNVQQTLAVV